MDVNNLGPFNSNVWGSYSDWLTVIFSAFAAGAAWRTLISQRQATLEQAEATRDQVRVNNLTLLTMQRAALPIISYQVKGGGYKGYRIDITFHNNGVYNVSFKQVNKEYIEFSSPIFESLAVGETCSIIVTYTPKHHEFEVMHMERPKYLSQLIINFETYLKKSYSQILNINDGGVLTVNEPTEIQLG